MSYDLGWLFGKMCPDYIHPALADDVDATAPTAEPSPAPTKIPASFAEVERFVGEFYQGIEGQTSSRSFPRLGTSGMQERGLYWTLSTLASHSADSAYSESSLGATLEPSVALKYYLFGDACRGVLRRAEKRGRALPDLLMEQLQIVARYWPASPKAAARIGLDLSLPLDSQPVPGIMGIPVPEATDQTT